MTTPNTNQPEDPEDLRRAGEVAGKLLREVSPAVGPKPGPRERR